MKRRRSKGVPWIATLPWPVGLIIGLLGFLVIRYGLGDGQLAKAFSPFAWAVLAMCWVGALASFIARAKRRQLLEAQTGLDSLGAMTWQQFEVLVGEAFRRRGYRVEENGLGGADGGVDLILSKDGRRELVQCKQWRSQQVGVAVVREMWGLAGHYRVDGIKIVSLGDYTNDAADFAKGKPIELINGTSLLELIKKVQAPSPERSTVVNEPTLSPDCPRCQGPMVERQNRATQSRFWGCSDYPKCRGTRPLEK
ncbi:MAG: restriction endonuclease [Lysobacteraceae bacterium]|nr:restriction endonuclease [Silanimonas sp.]